MKQKNHGFRHFRYENRVKEGLHSPGCDVEVEEAAAAPPSSESLDSSPVRSDPFFLNSYIWVDCVFFIVVNGTFVINLQASCLKKISRGVARRTSLTLEMFFAICNEMSHLRITLLASSCVISVK